MNFANFCLELCKTSEIKIFGTKVSFIFLDKSHKLTQYSTTLNVQIYYRNAAYLSRM